MLGLREAWYVVIMSSILSGKRVMNLALVETTSDLVFSVGLLVKSDLDDVIVQKHINEVYIYILTILYFFRQICFHQFKVF